MTYRKFKADYLFTGRGLAAPDSVLVTAGDGTVQSIVPADEAGEGVAVFSGMLSPGFVNCHCHLELSYLKGVIPERTGLVDFLATVIGRRGQSTQGGIAEVTGGEDRIRMAIAAGEQEMLDEGIVAVGDICNTTVTMFQKAAGRLNYHNFIETMGFIEERAMDRFARSVDVYRAFAEAHNLPFRTSSIVPHAPYSVSGALFRLIAAFPGNQLLTIHNQESAEENEFYLSGKGDLLRLYQLLGLDVSFFHGTGKRSLESIVPYFHADQSLILVHNLATREEDLLALGGGSLRRSLLSGGPELFFCLCPNANLYISGQLPDLELLLRHDCQVVVGTDSLASNHRLSVLEELKTLQRAFPQLPAVTLLQWATDNGARALQKQAVLGSFSPGRKPGVLLIGNMPAGRFIEGTTVHRLL
jgi:cytosine/adenosine deaminase-related metal-dependent hydrolase